MLRPVDVFHNLAEAEVAASVLRAAGIDAHIFDRYLAGLDFMYLQAIGGLRLMAPESQWEAARALLRTASPPPEPDPAVPERLGTGWRIAAVAAGLFMHPVHGWAVIAVSRRGGRDDKVTGMLLAVLAYCAAVAAGAVVVLLATDP